MWHAAALRGAFRALQRRQPTGAPAVVFLPEAEPGFLAAGLAGMEAAGYRLRGHALRLNDGQGVLAWESSPHRPPPPEETFEHDMSAAAQRDARQQGEPTSYGVLYAASTIELVRSRRLNGLWQPERRAAARTSDRGHGSRSWLPAGLWSGSSRGPTRNPDATGCGTPPTLRIRSPTVWNGSRSRSCDRRSAFDSLDLERRICGRLPGLKTPDRRLVHACLESYALEGDGGWWRLRSEDRDADRRDDVRQLRATLLDLGERLGLELEAGDGIHWSGTPGAALTFLVQETASFGAHLEGPWRQGRWWCFPVVDPAW